MRKRKLSSRESVILGLASDGLTDKQIAAQLQLNIGTVRTYWSRIREKLDAVTRAQAVGLHVRGTTGALDDSEADLVPAVELLCERLGLPSWTVDNKGQLIAALNRSGTRFLARCRLKPNQNFAAWMKASAPLTTESVARAIESSTSCNPGKAKVVRIMLIEQKIKGHFLFLPLVERGQVCCVVFVSD